MCVCVCVLGESEWSYIKSSCSSMHPSIFFNGLRHVAVARGGFCRHSHAVIKAL